MARRPAVNAGAAGRTPVDHLAAGYTGRSHIDEAFAAAGIDSELVLTAMDADVIKTCVELGLGVGVVASIAFEEQRDRDLRAIDAGHLFAVAHRISDPRALQPQASPALRQIIAAGSTSS